MTHARVEAIYIAPGRGKPTVPVDQAHVVPGLGIEGDRYYVLYQSGAMSSKPGHELTLIEFEALEAIAMVDGIPISPAQARRNIVTRGVSLNELVGRVFYVGDIQLRGLRLCEPCTYLADQTDPRIKTAMAHRGGLRVEIINEGIIHVNDLITIPE